MMDSRIKAPGAWPGALTCYVSERLQCEPELFVRPGAHLVVAHQPRLRVWQFAIPLWLMVFERAAVVSVAPELAAAVKHLLRGLTWQELLDDPVMESLRRLIVHWGPADWFRRAMWLYCTREMFAPRCFAEVVSVPPDHPEGRTARERHRGEVFGVFRGRELVSRASIKTESDAAWEIAVTTTEQYRRRGLGVSVVSRATEFIFAQGKPALYHCEVTNEPSRRLAESLGYRLFARELAWSVNAKWVPWFWREDRE